MVSSISPTLLPPPQLFPFLLPRTPQPHPTPIPKYGRTKFSQRRDLKEEGDILSDEEMEVEEMVGAHGHNFLVPLGKHMTLDEENVEAGEPSDPESSDSDSQARSRTGSASPVADLDADMQDLDADVHDLDASVQDLDADVTNEGESSVHDLDASVQDLDASVQDLDEEGESVVTDQSVADDEQVDEGL
ncbi:hypothetical protein BDV93DRAFT_511999 [Ceratobasidium sp. AG-I]|nr:hypothetical protein BDV93DRAFT_511999 [Ceratobasidium sp. AG-I]